MIKSGSDKKNILEAAELLKRGDLVAFSTETVYGLGANAFDENALKKIFEVKGRPTSDPLIIHIYDEKQLSEIVTEVPESAKKLMKEFWPGPLTLIFKKTDKVSPHVTAGLSTVAVRMPKHPVAQNLLRAVPFPIAAPSANRFQSISPTTAAAVEEELGGEIPLILDGGPSAVGVESTVLSVVDAPMVLRLGGITLEQLTDVLGESPAYSAKATSEKIAQVSPGLLNFHYAPKTPLAFLSKIEDVDKLEGRESYLYLVYSNRERDALIKKGLQRFKVLSPRANLEEAAQNLFATLREADKQKPKKIVAIKVPDFGLGKAINDRLKKAAHE